MYAALLPQGLVDTSRHLLHHKLSSESVTWNLIELSTDLMNEWRVIDLYLLLTSSVMKQIC